MRPLHALLTTTLVLASCNSVPGGGPSSDASDALARVVDLEWEDRLREDAREERADGEAAGLRQVGAADHARRAEKAAEFLAQLEQIDVESLSERDRVTHAMLARELDERVTSFLSGDWQIPWNSDSGFHTALARMPSSVDASDEDELRAYLERLRAMPGVIDAQIANLRLGMERGWTLPRVILDGFEGSFQVHVVTSAEESVFFEPFMGADEELANQGREVVMEEVVPAWERLLEFFVEEYRPGARTTLGASEMPGGAEYYASRVRWFTTLDVTPREIHDIGLAEVARIREAMEAIVSEVEFEGDLAAFIEYLRTDERFYAKTPEELLSAASRIAKRADAELPRFFGNLPRQPYGVEPVPDSIAPRYTAGRYVPAPRGGTEAGTYWVNTYALESRPLYVLAALTLHEAVPGHHLQIALTSELDDLPAFRRGAYINAFGEGWALYTEWLGVEMGIYLDPYEEFGRLTYEMWRACRLVIDTGLHAFGWSRDQAIEYLAGNTALSMHECRTEIDRYIGWPGQALAYKMGEIEIRELRRRAEEAAGDDFDIREFHDLVLAEGTVPLAVLRGIVERAYDL